MGDEHSECTEWLVGHDVILCSASSPTGEGREAARLVGERLQPGRGLDREELGHPGAVDPSPTLFTHVEALAAGGQQPLQRLDPRLLTPALDAGDRGLGDAGAGGESSLAQPHPPSGPAQLDTPVHADSVSVISPGSGW